MLELDRIEISLRARPLVRLTRRINAGEVLTLMGQSGCGKSTLLAALIGALPDAFALSGRVVLNGRDVTALPINARRIGILFQDALLFPHLSVGGNLAFALPPGTTDRTRRVDTALADAGLDGMAARDPATLSGGQRARVALMRTLLAEPEALLLDEPFSGLDTERRARIREFVFHHARKRGLPVLLVTHDREDARAAGGVVLGVDGTEQSL